MALATRTAFRAAVGICALWGLAQLTGCEGTFGASPPHAAPANPVAEAAEGRVELSWDAVTDASRYAIFWTNVAGSASFGNVITGIEGTSYSHTGLENDREYRYKIAAETSGGRGPESVSVRATPGTVPGAVEWTVVTGHNPRHTIHFAAAPDATHYRVYFAALETQLGGRLPVAQFEEADASPHVRKDIAITAAPYYRVIPMNDSRPGTGGPVAVSPARVINSHALTVAGAAFGRVDDDDCLDLPTALGGVETEVCNGSFTARALADVGLADLAAPPRAVADARLADLDGDGFDELFSNTSLSATEPGSQALLHLNQGNGNFQTSAAVSALGIRGAGGTLLAADFDNDGDVDLFAPHDHMRGDGARNWLLMNDGSAVFTDTAVAAGVATSPAGAEFTPRGGQAVDFDEDGFVDMMFGSRLLLNNGDGTFVDGSAAANFPVLEDQGMKLADIDLDGDLDLVHRTLHDTRLYRNDGGVFDAGALIGVEPEQVFGLGLNACDINGDGFEDVVVARNDPATAQGTPKILLNVDGELLPSATQAGTAADPDSLVAPNSLLACGDENADGMIDPLSRWGNTYRLLRGSSLTRRIQLRVVGSGGERNQQGRIVRVVPESAPTRIMTRVVDSGSGLRSQNMYDLLFGAPWTGDYDVTVRFADGDVTATLKAGDRKVIFANGRDEDIE